ncbi:hypothetical protein MRB53_013042 [Persea americana]|nr:hypothetical protein MRB53_013042 [Persea americana]
MSSEVAAPVLEFSDRRFPFRTPGGPIWGLSVGKAYLFAPNSITVTLTSSEVAAPVLKFSDRRFPFRTPGGPFGSLSVGKESLFAPNSLTVSPICELSVPTSYSHLERSGRAGVGIFRSPVPDPDPWRAVLEPKCRKRVPFRPKLPNCESFLQAVSSYRLHSCRIGIFRSPVPVPDPRRAVLEPKCRKRIPFRPKLPNRESYLRAANSNGQLSSRAKWLCRFRNFPVAGSRSGPPASRFGA